jgi:Protein of unknown function (DUF2026)
MKRRQKADKPPIKQADYRRIFRTIYSVLSNEEGDLTKSCFHFNFFASSILHQHYNLQAIPYVGNAGYCISEDPHSLICFFDLKDGLLHPQGENVHCWIHLNGWHIDFMAPLFPELAKIGKMPPCSRMQFCKPISHGKEHPNDLQLAGDFFAWPDKERTLSVVEELAKKPANADLMSICCDWFRKPPLKMQENILIGKGINDTAKVHLSNIQIANSW